MPLSAGTIYLFAALMGFLWLGTVPLTSGLVGQMFGFQYMSTLFGFVFFSHQLGSFLGIWLGGYVYDYTGNYDLIWYITIVFSLQAVATHWFINEKPVEDSLFFNVGPQTIPAT